MPQFLATCLTLALLGALRATMSGICPIRTSHKPNGAYLARLAEMAMLALINDFRAGRGLDPLRLSEPLGAAVTYKRKEMARGLLLPRLAR